MTLKRPSSPARPRSTTRTRLQRTTWLGLLALTLSGPAAAQATGAAQLPVTEQQRQTAQQVARTGIPLSDLAPDAPDSHTVKSGDTLWDISRLFLKSPWRWPELWGMNQTEINNPHLIYPGQRLLLVKRDGRAHLEVAGSGSDGASGLPTVKLSPQVRSNSLDDNPINAIPQHLIEPFLTDAIVFETNELASAPRIVGTQEGRVLLTRGDLAYAQGDLGDRREFRVFRQATALRDPGTGAILGYEAPYLGTAELLRPAATGTDAKGRSLPVPATLSIRTVRQEIGPGDRLAPVPPRAFNRYVPRAPEQAVEGRIISIYGEALTAGQNQIVALNKGAVDGLERGHVLALWQAGRVIRDKTSPKRDALQLPDERHGLLFVFQVYQRVSYALILSVQQPVAQGDRFSQP